MFELPVNSLMFALKEPPLIMKRIQFPIAIFLALCSSLLSCGTRGSADLSRTSILRGEDCLIGEWRLVQNGVRKSFSFTDDLRGKEVMSASDVRPYKWTRDGDKVTIVYDNDALRKWELTVNCESKELKVFGLAYSKRD